MREKRFFVVTTSISYTSESDDRTPLAEACLELALLYAAFESNPKDTASFAVLNRDLVFEVARKHLFRFDEELVFGGNFF